MIGVLLVDGLISCCAGLVELAARASRIILTACRTILSSNTGILNGRILLLPALAIHRRFTGWARYFPSCLILRRVVGVTASVRFNRAVSPSFRRDGFRIRVVHAVPPANFQWVS
jgi:hypothetical protein